MDGPRGRIVLGDSRSMDEIEDGSVQLIVTSPPYWDIKDYNVEGQIGRGSDLRTYFMDLFLVWKECFRALAPGRRLVINIGDQFTRSKDYGRYKVVPLHAEIISQCERIGSDFMGSIIWQKRTTVNTSGGAPIMGSYPYPPNGIVEIDHEYIMVFKKPGEARRPDRGTKESSALSKEEWKDLFSGHWRFGGARQVGHEALFPAELPSRLVRMFTFKGETVLDPFLGSGTTMRAALDLGRSGIGYEINRTYLPVIQERIGPVRFRDGTVSVFERPGSGTPRYDPEYMPSIPNMEPAAKVQVDTRIHQRVVDIPSADRLVLSDGKVLVLAGIRVRDIGGSLDYLRSMVLGKDVYYKEDPSDEVTDGIPALVYLRNRIFINRHMVKSNLAVDIGLPTGRRSR